MFKSLILSSLLVLSPVINAATLVLDGKTYEVDNVTITATTKGTDPIPDPQPDPDPIPVPPLNCVGTVEHRTVILGKTKLRLDMPPGRVYALKFVADESGRISLGPFGAYSPKLVTLSLCPGDFRTNMFPPACIKEGESATIRYTSDPDDMTKCTVNPGDVYYLNVKNGIIADPTAETCPVGHNCSFYVQRY